VLKSNASTGASTKRYWSNYKDTTGGRNQTFTYDLLNRLTSAQNAGTDCTAKVLPNKTEYWGNNYGYDAWGNMLSKAITKCGAENLLVTADAHNWIHASGAPDYQYDAAGNMTYDATASLSYTFDQENRLTGANGYTYTYDGDGNRVRKSNGNTAASGTLYWDMTPGVVAETDLAGTTKSEYVFFDGERVARRDGATGTGGVFYYFSDHLKTASVITDSAGVIKAESDYYPWGGELQFVNNDTNDYKFTGKKRDIETGLDYFGARYYSNGLGRWVSADWSAVPVPVPYADFEEPQSLNQYSYVRNIPTVKVDPDGHDTNGLAHGVEDFDQRMEPIYKWVAKALNHPAVQAYLEVLPFVGGAERGAAAGASEGAASGAEHGAASGAANGAEHGAASGATKGAESAAVPKEIPAGPSPKPTALQQREINEMGEAHGCSTCPAKTPGTKSGNWVGDHQPSTSVNPQGNPQTYRPQCLTCSLRQGGQLRAAQAKAAAAARREAAAAEAKQHTN
jgi:RHS repeat-associated protein